MKGGVLARNVAFPFSAMPGFDKNAQQRLARALKHRATELGFMACGISEATQLDQEARDLETWLQEGRHGTMKWMENHFDKRIDPRKLVPGAKTVISVLDNYYHPGPLDEPGAPASRVAVQTAAGEAARISRYAWGDDYHSVMKLRLAELYSWLDDQAGGISGRVFVDSAPVMDKAWARRSGLGWVGKHTNLITRQAGSWYFIGEMIVDVPLPADGPDTDHCGSCTRCLDACPTGAITAPYELDAERCISYLTIEYRGEELPEETAGQMGNWIYGCDVCQDVCPWNRFKKPSQETAYAPRPALPDASISEWEELEIEAFRTHFRGSAIKRAKYDGFMRNVRNAARNRSRGTGE
ncbi:MAG: epoxyqueuosine reductase [Rhodothermales bacterium]